MSSLVFELINGIKILLVRVRLHAGRHCVVSADLRIVEAPEQVVLADGLNRGARGHPEVRLGRGGDLQGEDLRRFVDHLARGDLTLQSLRGRDELGDGEAVDDGARYVGVRVGRHA